MFTFLRYGIDAPGALKKCLLGMCTSLCTALLALKYMTGYSFWGTLIFALFCIIIFLFCLYPFIAIIFGSIFLKFRERDWLISHLHITGSEKILDVGCGRGLLIIALAKKLTSGKAFGLDIWSHDDQTGNGKEATLKNIQTEHVENNTELVTADARTMPFENNTFDIIVSSWALHNIYSQEERFKALVEIDRTLKSNGQIAILDIDYAQEYEIFFKKMNYKNVSKLGPRRTFGNETYLIVAQK